MKNKLAKGFTLVELLVVIAIIAVLATLLILQLQTARSKSRDIKRVADVTQITTAAELYFDEQGKYPVVADLSTAEFTKFLRSGIMPKDPLDAAPHTYIYSTDAAANPKRYVVSAVLENKNAASLSTDSDINAGVAPWTPLGRNGADGTCNATTVQCVYDLGLQ